MLNKIPNPFKKRPALQKSLFLLSALVLCLPPVFYYQSLNPVFPEGLEPQQVGTFNITPMPFDNRPPYQHDGIYVKDYLLIFNQGDVEDIRQAYLNIGDTPLPLHVLVTHELGILHGTQHGQHVHALASRTLTPQDKLWLTIEYWADKPGEKGRVQIANWSLRPE